MIAANATIISPTRNADSHRWLPGPAAITARSERDRERGSSSSERVCYAC